VVCITIALLNLQQLYLGTPLKYPVYIERLAVKELQNATVNEVVFITEGKKPNESIATLFSKYAPIGVHVSITTEESVISAHKNGAVAKILPWGCKIIASEKLSPLLEMLLKSGEIHGPISKVIAEPYGDNVVTANDPSYERSMVSVSHVPRLVKDMLGLY
jgi:hypothetical protein